MTITAKQRRNLRQSGSCPPQVYQFSLNPHHPESTDAQEALEPRATSHIMPVSSMSLQLFKYALEENTILDEFFYFRISHLI